MRYFASFFLNTVKVKKGYQESLFPLPSSIVGQIANLSYGFTVKN